MPKRFVNPALLGPWCLVFLISLIWQLNVPAFAQSQPQGALEAKPNPVFGQETTAPAISPDLSKKNVLLLHAYTY